jgi:hypothetical protein
MFTCTDVIKEAMSETLHKQQQILSDLTRQIKTYGVPASTLDEATVPAEVDRSQRRRKKQNEYEENRKNKNMPSAKETHKMDGKKARHDEENFSWRDKSSIQKDRPNQQATDKIDGKKIRHDEESFSWRDKSSIEKDRLNQLSSRINHQDILKTMKWNSYSQVKSCSSDEYETLYDMLRGNVPISFRLHPCLFLLAELKNHQDTGMWSERSVLEEAFFLLLGLNEEQILDVTNWQTHPLVELDTWFREPDHCSWGGVTCGITTFGVGPGNQENEFDEPPSDSVEECINFSDNVRERTRCDGRRKLDGYTCKLCPPSNKVTKLDLTELDLAGVLPENLYMLTQLRRLNVMGNSIVGGIPATYLKFEHIEFIDVSKNEMGGPLPDHLPLSLVELWYVTLFILNLRCRVSVSRLIISQAGRKSLHRHHSPILCKQVDAIPQVLGCKQQLSRWKHT